MTTPPSYREQDACANCAFGLGPGALKLWCSKRREHVERHGVCDERRPRDNPPASHAICDAHERREQQHTKGIDT